MPHHSLNLLRAAGALALGAAGALALVPLAASGVADDASAVFGVTLPPGYRDWQVISVAHEAGNTNDIRAILGNDVAMRAFRAGTQPFPDGTIIARVAWRYEASAANNAAFGREQSFVAGAPTNVQISIRDGQRFASTGGWGYGQFEGGRPNRSEPLLNTCFPCHSGAATDLVFTRYSP